MVPNEAQKSGCSNCVHIGFCQLQTCFPACLLYTFNLFLPLYRPGETLQTALGAGRHGHRVLATSAENSGALRHRASFSSAVGLRLRLSLHCGGGLNWPHIVVPHCFGRGLPSPTTHLSTPPCTPRPKTIRTPNVCMGEPLFVSPPVRDDSLNGRTRATPPLGRRLRRGV